MKLLVVNPNSTAAMTDKIARSIKPFAATDTQLSFRNPHTSPASIEGHFDEAASLAGMLDIIASAERNGNDGTIIACFDDPGIGAAREIASGPVMGICEAAMIAASVIAARFSVVTTLPRSIPIIEDLAVRYGMERRCRRVHAADIAVLALEHDPDARMIVRDAVLSAVKSDGSDAIILGCAGMADLTDWLSQEAGVPVIDGCLAGLKIVEGLAGAKLTTSKAGAYAWPRAKN
ncbi:aspartate/glutamate racemase family protein [Aliihoeflea sp. PC F10.4]